MDTLKAVGNMSLQAAIDGIGIIEVWIPAYIINDALDSAESLTELMTSIEEYVDEEYNFHDIYVFTPESSYRLKKMFFNSNGLGDTSVA